MKRLYILVRSDLPTGLQLAQACHAAREFTLMHPTADVGDNLVVLHVVDERALIDYVDCATHKLLFREPDLDNAATALALDGSAQLRVSSLPLARF